MLSHHDQYVGVYNLEMSSTMINSVGWKTQVGSK